MEIRFSHIETKSEKYEKYVFECINEEESIYY